MALPPGPSSPSVVQMLRLFRDPIGMLDRCIRRYGDVFTLRWIGFGQLVYLTHPAAIKDVFTGDPSVFHAGEANEMMEPVLGPRSVLLLDEDEHLRQRRLLLPPFHGDRVRRYGELMDEIARAQIERWPLGAPFPLRPRMQAITLEVILRAVFGIREAGRLARLRSLIPRMLASSSPIMWFPFLRRDLGPLTSWRRFVAARNAIDEVLYDEIRRRRASGERGDDVLSLLVDARHEDGSPISEQELRDELVTLLTAGHETTATGLAWAFERLVRHPEALASLRAELETGGDTYLEAVVKETLRVRPVVFDVARLLKAPVDVAGYRLPEGVYVVPAITAVQRRPDLYPYPESFRPERFLDGQPQSYAWIPFGGGTRRCIGAAFASFEMKVVIRAVLSAVELRAPDPVPERAKLDNVTLVPARGTRVVVERRLARPPVVAPPETATVAP